MKLILSLIILFQSANFYALNLKNEPAINKNFIGFKENKGQVIDQTGATNTSVKYILAVKNNNITLTEKGFSYNVYKAQFKDSQSTNISNPFLKDSFEDVNYDFNRVDVEFVNSNDHLKILLDGRSSDFENYFNTRNFQQGLINIFSFNKITYLNVYNNIDVEFVCDPNGNKLFEYNFILHPNANINDIKLKYSGSAHVNIIKNNLRIGLQVGELTETIPLSYILETNKPISLNYKLIEGKPGETIVGFAGKIIKEKNETIVIDPTPVLDLGTYYGGSGDDRSESISTDNNGNFYVTGSTKSVSNIATTGAYQSVYGGGNTDAYIVKFNNAGQRKWATFYGGESWDYGYAIGTTSNGDIYISGRTSSTLNIASASAHQTSNGGGNFDAFLAKFDSTGNRIWGTYIGGDQLDESNSLTIDPSGNVYIIGSTESSSLIASAASYQPNYAGNYDAFIIKFNSSGIRQWGSYFGGSLGEFGFSITSTLNNLYITGSTGSSNGIALTGAYQSTLAGGSDIFLACFNFNGVAQWSTYFGGEGSDDGESVKIDGNGNIYVCGQTTSTTNIASLGAYQTVHNGLTDAFICKFSPSGSLTWSTYYGGEFYDAAYGIAIDNTSQLYLTGHTSSTLSIATSGASQINNAGGLYDAFVAKFSDSGNLTWGTYFGTPVTDTGHSIAWYANEIYVCGDTQSNSGSLCTTGAYQTTYGGGLYDAFIARFNDGSTIGFNEQSLNTETIKAFPNPTNGILYVETKADATIAIYDVLGKLVYVDESKNTKRQIDFSELNKGVFILILIESSVQKSMRIIHN